jgi:glycosyltransferase involved in cell wall biosynthesis
MKLDVPIDVLPAGIDTKLLKPQSRKKSREKLGLGDGKVYLCLGRLSFEKNLDFVINASKKFLDHDSRLLIVGRGPAMPRLQEQVRKLGIEDRVKFPGYVSDTEKVKYYSAADAFLMASTSETQGMVVLEAMACGCPVIAADALAIPEFVHDRKNGFLYRPNDEKQLIETIGGFDFTKKMSGKALDTAREYSVQKCTDRLEGLYELLSK